MRAWNVWDVEFSLIVNEKILKYWSSIKALSENVQTTLSEELGQFAWMESNLNYNTESTVFLSYNSNVIYIQ